MDMFIDKVNSLINRNNKIKRIIDFKLYQIKEKERKNPDSMTQKELKWLREFEEWSVCGISLSK
jgi:hypothetical protein